MKVTVKLFAFLRQGRFAMQELTVDEGTKVEEIMARLSISKKEMEIGIIMINGLQSTFQSELHQGDILSLFPPAAGG